MEKLTRIDPLKNNLEIYSKDSMHISYNVFGFGSDISDDAQDVFDVFDEKIYEVVSPLNEFVRYLKRFKKWKD